MHVFPSRSASSTMHSPLSHEARRRAYEEDPKWPVKTLLRLIAILLSVIATGLFAASISYTDSRFSTTAGPPGDWTDGFALAIALISLVYNTCAISLHLYVRGGRPLHPALHLILDLFTWLLAVPAVVVAVAGGIFWFWTAPLPSIDGGVDCGILVNAFAMQCAPVVYTIGRLEIVGCVLLVMLFVLHFALFAMDCVELLRCRRAAALALPASGVSLDTVKDVDRGYSSHSSA